MAEIALWKDLRVANGSRSKEARVVVTFSPPAGVGPAFGDELDAVAAVVYLPEMPQEERAEALRSADALLSWFPQLELQGPEEFGLLESVGLVQLVAAGADGVPFDLIPAGVEVAVNAGAFADPMAEHVLAMALALAKRLPQNSAAMASGEFDQLTPTREIRGSVVGILGFGGIGQASARQFRPFGAEIYAFNRSRRGEELADRFATRDDELDEVLADADIVVISLPLTNATRGLIGGRQLSLMKPDAILVNVARAAIIDEDALYKHLRSNPSFMAGIDAWWQEPATTGAFKTRHPFLELPNVLGSPHNSAVTSGSLAAAARQAAKNVARYVRGERGEHLINRLEYTRHV